ncbi:MAG: hypothetical protein KIG22_02450, partial [Oxalobacter sp.]|nr:hypothetical protein [Oxalobacter sp.]
HHARIMPASSRNGETRGNSDHSRLLPAMPLPPDPTTHTRQLIPVSCGQLRVQSRFSVYRQQLAPAAHSTGTPPTSARKHPARPPVRQNKQVSPLEITTANGIPATGNITQPFPISRKTSASHVNITATDTQSGKKRQHRHIAPS